MNAVILRCKNCDEANWKIYIKKICGASTCRMTMIRRALDSPMSKDLPRYLQRCRRPHRKFSRVAWKKSSSSKHEVLSEYSSLTLSFIFQNLNFFHFVQTTLENFLWGLRQRSRYLGGPPNLVLCVSKKIVTIRRTNRIIRQEKWKKLRFWKMKLKVKLEYSDKTSCFELSFFRRHLEKFCALDEHVQCIWKISLT